MINAITHHIMSIHNYCEYIDEHNIQCSHYLNSNKKGCHKHICTQLYLSERGQPMGRLCENVIMTTPDICIHIPKLCIYHIPCEYMCKYNECTSLNDQYENNQYCFEHYIIYCEKYALIYMNILMYKKYGLVLPDELIVMIMKLIT